MMQYYIHGAILVQNLVSESLLECWLWQRAETDLLTASYLCVILLACNNLVTAERNGLKILYCEYFLKCINLFQFNLKLNKEYFTRKRRVFLYSLWALVNYIFVWMKRSRRRVVDIATGYGLCDRGGGVRVPLRSGIFSSPRYPYRLWDPPYLLPNRFRRMLPRD